MPWQVMNDQPCAANASACCCNGKDTIPCVQNASGASPERRCAQFATGHLLSRVSYEAGRTLNGGMVAG